MTHQKLLRLTGIAFVLLLAGNASAQLTINSAQFFIQSGATVTVQGDVTSNVDILGTGLLLLKGSTNQNVNMGGFNIPNLELDNTSNATLTGNASITGDFKFTNGFLQLGTNNLAMGSAATITNAANTKFIVTNNTGRLIKAALGVTAFNYPVGNTTITYNPVSISNAGTADSIGVRSLTNAYKNGLTGPAFIKDVVDASWDISEAVAGGSNLSLTSSWYSGDELTGFNRAKSGIGYYITSPPANVGWDLLFSQTAAATGTNPYSLTRTGISTLGTFAVGGRAIMSPLLVSPKVFLQGPFNAGNGTMNESLRLLSLIPTSSPYDTIPGYVVSGSGGGETTTAPVLAVTDPNTSIVDWVFVQLHQASDSSVISTAAALIQRNGVIVDLDGVSPMNMAGYAPGNYYLSVRHRNHLGVRTAGTLNLAKISTTVYDFTTALSQAYQGNPSPPNPVMATLNTGVYGMYGGNANSDLFTKKVGSASTNDYSLLIAGVNSAPAPGPTNVYRREDFNMDGNVRKTGSPLTNDYSKLLNILGVLTIIQQPSF